MYFNSLSFLFFFVAIFFSYWFVLSKRLKLQNLFILMASYFFYGSWDWRFLALIIVSSLTDYLLGIRIEKESSQKRKKLFLGISIVVNIGILFIFKYYNFFAESLSEAASNWGWTLDTPTLEVILPVGISFYTFQTLSYSIDIYRGKLKASKDWVSFFAYVAFFPQLVAGPIERASRLLPQFQKARSFNYAHAINGLQLILWGLFKKVVVADNCGVLADQIFSNYQELGTVDLICGSFLFAFQIYGDFSGYSDIAIGLAALMGFGLMRNFAYPYFSRDISEFWRRWHISLSTWFRDYLYIPLGGSKASPMKALRNVWIVFLVSGFWHGANWTFLIWGAVHAAMYTIQFLRKRNRKYVEELGSSGTISLKEILSIVVTFLVCSLAWVFFRAESATEAFSYLGRIFTNWSGPTLDYTAFLAVAVMLVLEWFGRKDWHPIKFNNSPVFLKWGVYLVLAWSIIAFQQEDLRSFIYFQF